MSTSKRFARHVSDNVRGGRMHDVATDWVVLAVAGRPLDDLYLALKQPAVDQGRRPVERVGDCVAPRRIHAAVIEGDRAGARR